LNQNGGPLDSILSSRVGDDDFFNSLLKSIIEQEEKAGNLSINFVQRGGKIAAIPTDLNTARTRVAALSTEEENGPRPIYATVVPYSE
jgi:hypothetical protein